MDKITRVLLLYSKLKRGEKISKIVFCMEADCGFRSFERDVEDVRLYLSEEFSNEELIYDRRENLYYLSGINRKELELMEYVFIERILIDMAVLRRDELDGLLSHLSSNTKNSRMLVEHQSEIIAGYVEPENNKPILKMHGDLSTVIKNKAVIRIMYIESEVIKTECTVIPCSIKYREGYLYFIAFKENELEYPTYFRLDRIYSFSILRSQFKSEQLLVDEYLLNHLK